MVARLFGFVSCGWACVAAVLGFLLAVGLLVWFRVFCLYVGGFGSLSLLGFGWCWCCLIVLLFGGIAGGLVRLVGAE